MGEEALPKSAPKAPAAPLAPANAPVALNAPDKPKTAPLSADTAASLTATPGAAPKIPEAGADTAAKPQETVKSPETWQQAFEQVRVILKDNGVLNDPLAGGFLALAAMLLQFGGDFMDFMPGHFEEKLKNSTEELTEEEKKAVKAATAKRELAADEKARLAEMGKKDGIERASTKYAARALWGIDNIETAESLFSKLRNSKDNGNALYEETNLEAMKKSGYPFGALITFAISLNNPSKIVAFATGNKDEFEYFDPKKGEPVRFFLSAPDSPVQGLTICAMRPLKTVTVATTGLDKKP